MRGDEARLCTRLLVPPYTGLPKFASDMLYDPLAEGGSSTVTVPVCEPTRRKAARKPLGRSADAVAAMRQLMGALGGLGEGARYLSPPPGSHPGQLKRGTRGLQRQPGLPCGSIGDGLSSLASASAARAGQPVKQAEAREAAVHKPEVKPGVSYGRIRREARAESVHRNTASSATYMAPESW